MIKLSEGAVARLKRTPVVEDNLIIVAVFPSNTLDHRVITLALRTYLFQAHQEVVSELLMQLIDLALVEI